MVTRGRNNGVSGLVDIPGVSPSSPFVANILGWNLNNGISAKPRMGRGSGRWPKARYVLSSGKLVLSGELRFDAPPIPTAWQNHEGNVTIQLDQKDQTIKKVTIPVRITGASVSKNEKREDTWNISLSAEVTAECTFAGFGDVPAGTIPTASNQEQYAGTSKTLDPNGLQTSAVRTVDIWGTFSDTDSAEFSLMADALSSATAPATGLKKRFASFSRDSIDGGTLVIQFGLNDTLDDQQLPQQRETVDDNMLQSSNGYGAVFNYGGTEPTDPVPPAGLKIVTHTDVRINPTKSIRIWTMSPSDSADSIELPNNKETVDTHGLASAKGYAKVFTSGLTPTPPTPPAGQKIITYTDVPLNPLKSVRIWTMGPNDTLDELMNGSTSANYSQGGGVSHVPEVVTLSTDLSTTLNSIWQANKNSLTFQGVTGRVLQPGKVLAIKEWVYNDFKINASFRVDATPYWTASGDVMVSQVKEISDTMSYVLLQPGTTGRVRGSLRIYKRLITNGFTSDLVKYGIIGRVNNSAWLNFASGTLLYTGSDPQYQGNIASDHCSEVIWNFEFDSLGFPNESPIIKEWFLTDATVTPGVTNASSVFGWNVNSTLPTSDFGSVFGYPQ